MELQVLSGLQQGVHRYQSPLSTHNSRKLSWSFDPAVSCCVLATKFRNPSTLSRQKINSTVVVECCSNSEGKSGEKRSVAKTDVVLKAGSAVVVTEAPPLLKTAEPMPMMRPNNGLINVGDAGRCVLCILVSLSLFSHFVLFFYSSFFLLFLLLLILISL